ncbi:MAG: hypothetical protein JST02_02335, partial [Bacteroidetes bacterium]|nr:hypothetical protein [Bacteroidota bacterium]
MLLFRSLPVIIVLFFFCIDSEALVRYVKPGSAGTAPYLSWGTASNDLQAVINASSSGDQIWVAAGTYKPNRRADATGIITPNDRFNAFVLKPGVKIYGGFKGTELSLSARNYAVNVTTLSGDIGIATLNTDNCYHVVISAGSVGSAVLDGFTITRGNANGATDITVNAQTIYSDDGGGVFVTSSSPAIGNCKIISNLSSNHGGGLFIIFSLSAITNTSFTNNTAKYGGGMFNGIGSAGTISGCLFNGNSASIDGGGLFHGPLGPIANSVFSGNAATNSGGAIYINGFDASITNCIIAGNVASNSGGGIFITNSGVRILINCVVWGNLANTTNNIGAGTISYSLIEGGYAGTGNINADPLFVNPLPASSAPTTGGDYHLQRCSPALDVGNNAAIPGGITTDLDGNPRIFNTTVDMGAYEKQYALPDANGIVYVDKTKSGDGKTWVNAVTELADALKAAKSNTAITEIWVAKGTYYPLYDAATLGCAPADNRDKSFVLVNDVKVYGGFSGGETDTAGRDFVANETILSGDFNNDDIITGSGATLSISNNTENSYHVLGSAGAAGTARLDGFTVQKGNADGSNTITVNTQAIRRNRGGGMYNYLSSPIITNCTFTGNLATYGGGVYNDVSSPIITKSKFTCYSVITGAGMYNYFSSPTISNSTFTGNAATTHGGGMFNYSSSPIIANSSFAGNLALYGDGGGMYNYYSSSPTISNSTFTGNSASTGGGILNSNTSTAVIKNSIVWGNKSGTLINNILGTATVTHSLV